MLTLRECIGGGCAEEHHHVYDISGAEPRSLGVLSHGGHMVFPYLEITDLDDDGVDELFVGSLQGDDPGLAAEAARALGQLGDHGDVLRRAFFPTMDPEVKRWALASIAELDDPGPARIYLDVLRRPTTSEVRRRLHSQLARMPDPADVHRGLAQVCSHTDYGAYPWRAVYRPESLDEAKRAVLRTDAAAWIADEEARIRQYAAQILGAVGVGDHATLLKDLAEGDPEPYVGEAAANALK